MRQFIRFVGYVVYLSLGYTILGLTIYGLVDETASLANLFPQTLVVSLVPSVVCAWWLARRK